jgi:D-glycero-beta-D-manno-heptose-7-phosphate kinase
LKSDRLAALVPKLAGHTILVVGDVILDEYLIGRANRLSREAPIPVLEFERREHIPGGAGNPSMNIMALGSAAIQVGVVGEDSDGATLKAILRDHGIDPAGVVSDSARPTTTKTRIMAHMGLRFPQQLARVDRIDRRPVSGAVEQTILAAIAELGQGVEAVIVSDYLTGLLTAPIVAAVRELSRERNLLATADAQGELDKYSGFDLVKCNADEAALRIGHSLTTDSDFADAGMAMTRNLDLRGGVLITRGPGGVTLVERDKPAIHIPAIHVEDVYDTVGAGDTVLAVMTLAMAAGASYADAAALANVAAGIVVRKVGNYAPLPADLLTAIQES